MDYLFGRLHYRLFTISKSLYENYLKICHFIISNFSWIITLHLFAESIVWPTENWKYVKYFNEKKHYRADSYGKDTIIIPLYETISVLFQSFHRKANTEFYTGPNPMHARQRRARL